MLILVNGSIPSLIICYFIIVSSDRESSQLEGEVGLLCFDPNEVFILIGWFCSLS